LNASSNPATRLNRRCGPPVRRPAALSRRPTYQELIQDYEDDLNKLESDVETLSSEAISLLMSNPNCARYSGVINDAIDRMTFGDVGRPGVGQLIVTEKTMPPPEGWLEFLRPSKVKEKPIPDHIRKRVRGASKDPHLAHRAASAALTSRLFVPS
jgi:hypothetical protein